MGFKLGFEGEKAPGEGNARVTEGGKINPALFSVFLGGGGIQYRCSQWAAIAQSV